MPLETTCLTTAIFIPILAFSSTIHDPSPSLICVDLDIKLLHLVRPKTSLDILTGN